MTDATPSRGWRLGLGLVLAVAAWARMMRIDEVYVDGDVVPLDGDSVHHLWRMMEAARNGLSVRAVDPFVDWPFGAAGPWAPGFDVVGGLFALVGGASAACALPVVLGLALVALTALTAQRVTNDARVSLSAAALAALNPQLISSSLFGRTDHHVWEALTMLGLTAWGLSRRPSARWESLGALIFFLTLWGFSGGTIYAALLTAALIGLVLTDPAPRWMGSGAPALGASALLTVVGYWSTVAEHRDWLSYKRASLVQPVLLACAAGAVALAVLVAQRTPGGVVRRAVRWSVLLLAALAIGAVALPPVRAEIAHGLSEWVGRTDPWIATIGEFEPFLGGAIGPRRGVDAWGWLAMAMPLLVPLGLWQVTRRAPREGLVFAWLTVALVGLTLLQMRFGRVSAPFALIAALAPLAQATRSRSWAFWAGLGAMVLVDPALHRALVEQAPRGSRPGTELSRWLARHGDPSRGVLAPWEEGFYVEAVGHHPVVANAFGSHATPEGYAVTQRFWRESPEALSALFEQRKLGWWVDGVAQFIGATRLVEGKGLSAERGGRLSLDPSFVRDHPLAAVVFGGSGDAKRGVAHLAHFWPRAASSERPLDIGRPLPALWLLQWVPAARLSGRSDPGVLVEAHLELIGDGVRFPYSAWTRADSSGGWALELPIPTGFDGPGLASSASWTVQVGTAVHQLTVPVEAVLRGSPLTLATE